MQRLNGGSVIPTAALPAALPAPQPAAGARVRGVTPDGRSFQLFLWDVRGVRKKELMTDEVRGP